MLRDQLRLGVAHVGRALRDPEDFTAAWNEGAVNYAPGVWLTLLATAALGTTSYGMVMGMLGGPGDVLAKGFACSLAAGLAWGIPLPALYILNSLAGSRLSASSTLLAALVTTSWGGLAMLASIPVAWFFTVAIPHPWFVLVLHLIVFGGVGVAMIDVFHRVLRRLEPERASAPTWWLILVGVIGAEFFFLLGLFDFGFVSSM
jgi:hypothetical protein